VRADAVDRRLDLRVTLELCCVLAGFLAVLDRRVDSHVRGGDEGLRELLGVHALVAYPERVAVEDLGRGVRRLVGRHDRQPRGDVVVDLA